MSSLQNSESQLPCNPQHLPNYFHLQTGDEDRCHFSSTAFQFLNFNFVEADALHDNLQLGQGFAEQATRKLLQIILFLLSTHGSSIGKFQ